MKSFNGYKKLTIGDSEVLLAGGGSKALSDFLMSSIAANTYLPRNTNSEILPLFSGSPFYLLGIEAFSDGGTIKWLSTSNITVGLATNADTVDNLHASNLVRFFLSPMAAEAPADSAKSWFVNTMPSGSGAIVYNVPGSEKTIIAGKSTGAYGHMLQLNYNDTYLRILRYQGGSWKSTDWEKISAGYADSAGSVTWGNVSGKPTIVTNPYTGHVQITGRIFGYNYGNQGSNAAAFMWDKPGANYTGLGSNGVQDQIYFGACDTNGNWVSYKLVWRFNGSIYADFLNGHTPAYQTYDNNFILHSNEFNFIPDNYNLVVYFNYQSPSRNSSSTVLEYRMCNGKLGYTNVVAANFYTSSDKILKTNINSISNILPIVEFDWKENKKHSYGFIAQLIEKEYPELVSNGETKTVNYSAALSLYLAKLSNIVEQNNNNIKTKIIEMERRIDKLENKFLGGPSKIIGLFKYKIAI